MNHIFKDRLDNLLCIPLDASHEEQVAPPRRQNKRRSLFNYNQFKEDIGYPLQVPGVQIEEAKESDDTTDIESSPSNSSSHKSLSDFYEKPSRFVLSNVLQPDYVQSIQQAKRDVFSRFSGRLKSPVKVNLNQTRCDFYPKGFYDNRYFGNVHGLYQSKVLNHEHCFN